MDGTTARHTQERKARLLLVAEDHEVESCAIPEVASEQGSITCVTQRMGAHQQHPFGTRRPGPLCVALHDHGHRGTRCGTHPALPVDDQAKPKLGTFVHVCIDVAITRSHPL